MNLETAVALVDTILFELGGKHLRVSEIIILRGTLQGFTYEQMSEASEYSTNYLMRDAAPKFWKRLSQALGEPVYKTNIRSILERLSLSSDISPTDLEPNVKAESEVEGASNASVIFEESSQALWPLKLVSSDVCEIPLSSFFHGRHSELATLHHWIVEEQARLCGIWGLSGMGKTALLKQVMRQCQDRFDVVLWRSLCQAPSLSELLSSLVVPTETVPEETQQWTAVISAMNQQSCLLILDDVESILEAGQLSGHYRERYENYGAFFEYFAQVSHQGCIVIAGLDPVREVTQGQGVQSLQLSGLLQEASCALSEAMQLKKVKDWEKLTEIFQGHPAALKITAKLIRDLFGGNVKEFLTQQSFMFEELEQCLRPSIERISVLEKEVVYDLATQERPISVSDFELMMQPAQLLEALDSLRRRALLQVQQTKGKSLFCLAPMISSYVRRQLFTQVSNPEASQPQHSVSPQGGLYLSQLSSQPTTLSQWFDNNFGPTWQPIDALFDHRSNPTALKLRSVLHLRDQTILKRCKQILIGNRSMIMLIAIEQDMNSIYKMSVQVQPTSDPALPAGVALNLLNPADQVLATIVSKAQDSFIQLPYFWGNLKEQFKIQVSLKQTSHVEAFVI
ncbi:MAG: DUF1822 family protein [Thermosynechococcaceae cyanobacterium]